MKARATLAANLRKLMEIHDLRSQGDVGRFASVSQTMVGNILRQDQAPRLDFLEDLAAGFKVPIWALIGPSEFLDGDEGLERLVKNYARSEESSRQMIQRLAESEADRAR